MGCGSEGKGVCGVLFGEVAAPAELSGVGQRLMRGRAEITHFFYTNANEPGDGAPGSESLVVCKPIILAAIVLAMAAGWPAPRLQHRPAGEFPIGSAPQLRLLRQRRGFGFQRQRSFHEPPRCC